MKLLPQNKLKSERIRKGAAANPAGIFSCGIFSWDSVFDRVNDLCAVVLAFVAVLVFALVHSCAASHAFTATHAHAAVRACVASVLAVMEAVAAYVLLFVRADRDQAEDAEQISSSWWGYRILIPVYVVCLMCFIPPDFRWDNIFLMAIVLVGAFIGFFAYRRSFRLQRSDFISIGVTYAVGIFLMLIGG